MTDATLWRLARKLEFPNQTALLAEWSLPTRPSASTALNKGESDALQSRYVAFMRNGLWHDALDLALSAVSRAADNRLQANWADLVADAYRTGGGLREAARYYSVALAAVHAALSADPHDLDLRYLAGRIRFGQIIVEDYQIEGAFGHALERQGALLAEIDRLIGHPQSGQIQTELVVRRVHIRRQQAEMHRLLGQYGRALSKIREVLDEYPESEFEPRYYAQISQADSARQMLDHETAGSTYDRIERVASHRDWPALATAVMWRKASLLRACGREGEARDALARLRALAERRTEHKLSSIYYHLAFASGASDVVREGLEGLAIADQLGQLDPHYMALEYTHVTLCRAELYRQLEDERATGLFRKAHALYARMECRWGVVRSWIGLKLCGASAEPLAVVLEGGDAELLARYHRSESFAGGVLSASLL